MPETLEGGDWYRRTPRPYCQSANPTRAAALDRRNLKTQGKQALRGWKAPQ